MESDPNKTKPIQELLASKKQEKPDQDFFSTFSDKVLTRLEEPTPKPTIWERLNEKVDPLRAATALFAIVVGSTLIYGLDEGSAIVEIESENNPLNQANSQMTTDITMQNLKTIPSLPLTKSRDNALAEFGMSTTIRMKPEPPRILMSPGANLIPSTVKGQNFLRNNSPSNKLDSPK
ncbi:MAG: hypothetical protein CMO77_09455 [Verrucomicrobiales bacterium]|nr:hypothetical protein [Verrucomicrobiales bacterium]|tara:strand:+ start:2066 stop:2596 length:531 start_codon:yes stop_codon:yes gene_type:complete